MVLSPARVRGAGEPPHDDDAARALDQRVSAQARARRPSRPAPRRLPVAEEFEPAQGWSYRVYERRKSKIVIVILFDGGKAVRRSEWPRLNMLQCGNRCLRRAFVRVGCGLSGVRPSRRARATAAAPQRVRIFHLIWVVDQPRNIAPAWLPHRQGAGAAKRRCRDRTQSSPRTHPSGRVRCRHSRGNRCE